MMRKIKAIIICLFLISCGQNNQTDQKNEKDTNQTSFEEYTGKIKLIDLPFKASCGKPLDGSKLDFPDSTITKYGEAGSRIYGKLAENKNYTAIIYLAPADIVLPVIVTNDKKGNKISKLVVYERMCGDDEFGWGTSSAEISKDLTISLSDSSVSFKRDLNGKIMDSTRKTEVRHRKFYIKDDGKIENKK
jgi:hypothetical protein